MDKPLKTLADINRMNREKWQRPAPEASRGRDAKIDQPAINELVKLIQEAQAKQKAGDPHQASIIASLEKEIMRISNRSR